MKWSAGGKFRYCFICNSLKVVTRSQKVVRWHAVYIKSYAMLYNNTLIRHHWSFSQQIIDIFANSPAMRQITWDIECAKTTSCIVEQVNTVAATSHALDVILRLLVLSALFSHYFYVIQCFSTIFQMEVVDRNLTYVSPVFFSHVYLQLLDPLKKYKKKN